MFGHMSDTERIFGYRALRIARADQTPLAGYEQDDYVAARTIQPLRLADLMEDLPTVRHATLSAVPQPRQANGRRGAANNNRLSARAIAYIIAGHELHHRRILGKVSEIEFCNLVRVIV